MSSHFQFTLLRSKPLHLSSFVPAQVQMFSEGDIGVLPPLGVYDPLGLIETRDMRRYEIMVRSEVWISSKSIRILRYL